MTKRHRNPSHHGSKSRITLPQSTEFLEGSGNRARFGFQDQGTGGLQGLVHPLVQAILSLSPMPDTAQRPLMILSQHVLHLEEELSNLKRSINSSLTTSDLSRSSSYTTTPLRDQFDGSDRSTFKNDEEIELAEHLQQMTITTSHKRHFGSSSTMALLGTAIQIGKECKSERMPDEMPLRFRRAEFWSVNPVSSISRPENLHN